LIWKNRINYLYSILAGKWVIEMARKLLLVNPEKCTGCGTCETACSLKHFGECNPAQSLIKALRHEKMGSYFFSVPVVCQQCEIPLCMDVCPVNAIQPDLGTGAYLVDEKKCVGCRLCEMACPLGAIEIHPDKNVAMKCDLCGGEPICVKFCLPGALTYVSEEKIGFARRREAIKKLSRGLEKITLEPRR
jgi:Fe-S-cluster-containing hydrogenase component 2